MNEKIKSYGRNFGAVALLYLLLILLMRIGVINSYYQGIIIVILINIILTVSLNLTTGFLGQLALGHAGFMAVGAYVSGIFTKTMNLPAPLEFAVAIALAGIFAAVCGIIIGVPALRLKGDYLAIITLGFGEIIRNVINNLKITNGAKGYRGISAYSNFTLIFVLMAVTVYVICALVRSRHGRAILSIREDEIAAEASGINTTYYKLFAFSLAAFFAGIAGALYAHYMTVLDPKVFNYNYSIEMVIMVVLGGMGSITGSIISAIFLTFLPQLLSDLERYRMLIYSIALILIMMFKPSGLLGTREFSLTEFLNKMKDRSAKKAAKEKR